MELRSSRLLDVGVFDISGVTLTLTSGVDIPGARSVVKEGAGGDIRS